MRPSAAALLSVLLALALPARAEPPLPGSAGGLLSFADALLAEGESFRAVTEYQRLLHHFPVSPQVPPALAGLGKAYAQAGRWDESAEAFRRLGEAAPSAEARSLLGAALYRGGRHREAARVLLADAPPGGDAALGTLALLRAGVGSELPPAARADWAAEFDALPRKNPGLAGTLAAVLPGAGHAYVGRPRDAAVAFLLNASFLWAAWEAARREEWALAGVVGLLELGWYSGNVVSAMNGAYKWNRREEQRFFDRREAGLVPSWSLAPLPGGAAADLSWRW